MLSLITYSNLFLEKYTRMEYRNSQSTEVRHGPSITSQPAPGRTCKTPAHSRHTVAGTPPGLVPATGPGPAVVAGQSQPVDERTDTASTQPGLAERAGAGPR
ncbi:hypothetical protein D3C79_717750 [compost metagenome]